MNSLKITCLFLFIFFLLNPGIAQNNKDEIGYNINVKLEGFKNSKLYLGYHFGHKKFIIDTSFVDANNTAVFEGKNKLEGGIYLIILPSKKFFEIVIDQDQHFYVETDTSDFIMSMKVKDSEENTRFNNYQKNMRKLQVRMYDLKVRMNSNLNHNDSLAYLEKELKKYELEVKQLWKDEALKNEGSLLGKLIKAMIEPEYPQNYTPKDSLEAVRYYKKHYFDNIDFSDERMLKTPILNSKIKNFLENYLDYHPDSIISLLNYVIAPMKKNNKVYKYMIMQILSHFETNILFGYDEVFIYIAEKYFINDADFWKEPVYLSKIQNRVDVKKRIITGQIAPDLKLKTINDEPLNLYGINSKMTILYFWNPDCGHCQIVTPELHTVYEKYKEKGIIVFAVFTEGNKEEWNKYIHEKGISDWINVYDPDYTSKFKEVYDIMGTPIMFVLDENKRIIAKKINPSALEKIINFFLK
ncbi:MAG TPA: hypothetical protein DDX39_07635 [Bacteroidales bacterium]|nr:MAG: hypothetical protein A2W98_14480 [Bacteroidetes bacterium GWF2_33_38]OFY90161.1 MAG: hypothetical protein A2236_12595 [Bacteroidetes bacterium RIFOXYA2_FULL_33_7]HBF88496.1 hypothetical protein [Bacteroidales bacterium]